MILDGDPGLGKSSTALDIAAHVTTGRAFPDGCPCERGSVVLLTAEDSYHVASKVHDLTVKTRPADAEKICLIRDLIAKNVNVQSILEAL